MPTYEKWTTNNEIDFLKNLGSFSTTTASREELLRGYRAGMKRRTEWDGLDKKEIEKAVESML